MINNPDILFMDEPTVALNSGATDQVLAILEGLNNEGMTIMTVTHDPPVAPKAKKVLYIKDGNIASSIDFAEGTSHEKELDAWLKGLKTKE
jgi:putative ABC transport system ATP-binding protein